MKWLMYGKWCRYEKEVNGNTIRYYCNDGVPDKDFDDLVFEVSLL